MPGRIRRGCSGKQMRNDAEFLARKLDRSLRRPMRPLVGPQRHKALHRLHSPTTRPQPMCECLEPPALPAAIRTESSLGWANRCFDLPPLPHVLSSLSAIPFWEDGLLR